MELVLEFLNQPIVLTLLTLIVGSYLLSIVADHRSRKDKLKDKAIEFIIDAGKNINEFLPHVYSHLRTGSIQVDQDVRDGLKNLFSKSLSIQIGSKAYLKSDEFHKQYLLLLNELGAVVSLITELEQGAPSELITQKVQQSRKRLAESWYVHDEQMSVKEGTLVDEFIVWMDMIIHRTGDLLTSHLKSVLR